MTSILHPLRIGKHIARYPIVQGAMAVRVSGAKLAGAVANAGGIGVIALIVENCQLVGGHFTQCEHANSPGFSIESVISQLRDYLEQQVGVMIPLIVTGGISDRSDIDRILAIGADGVQMGTRFITTEECDADQRYKDCHIKTSTENIVTVPSPVGKPTRALRNSFAEQAIIDSSTRLERQCIANCLEACLCRDSGKTYCLLQALAKAARGDVEHGLIFSGANVSYTERIMSVTELMAELTQPQKPM